MKKIGFLFGIIGMFGCCKTAERGTATYNRNVIGTESLPSGQCVYTVRVDSTYTFIDDDNKYKLGEEIK